MRRGELGNKPPEVTTRLVAGIEYTWTGETTRCDWCEGFTQWQAANGTALCGQCMDRAEGLYQQGLSDNGKALRAAIKKAKGAN